MDDRALVAAIREGNPAGLAGAYDSYADALYSFCLAMLHDRSSAEDAVQDTFVVLAQRVTQLREPDRLRPWLYAVARSQCLRQLRAVRRVTPVDEWDDAMSAEPSDFEAGVHSAQLQALVWQAMGGLNAGERAALELSLRHGLEGDDLAAALDVTRSHANKLLERGRTELERSLAALLVARDPSRCAGLATIVAGWDGVMTPLMRKRIARHIDGCSECGEQKRRRVSAVALLSAIPILAAPAALRTAVVGKFRLVSDDSAVGARDTAALRAVAGYDAAGFPTTRPRRRRVRGAMVAAAGAAVLTGILVLHPGSSPHTRPAAALAASRTATSTASGEPTSTTPVARSSTSSAPRPVRSTARPAPSALSTPPPTSTSMSMSPTSPPPSPTGSTPASSAPVVIVTRTPTPTPHPSGPRPTTIHPSTRPPSHTPTTPRTTTPTTPKPVPAVVTASVNPGKYPAATGGSGVLTISVTGADVHWHASATDGVTLSPASGAIPAGQSGHTKVIVPPAAPGTVATITVTWATGSTTAQLTWS